MDLRRPLLYVLILVAAPLAAANNCCPNETVFMKHTRSCEYPGDDDPHFIQRNLNCTLDMYLLDPVKDPLDVFTVLEDGHLQVGEVESYTIPPHMFCVTKVQMEKNDPNNIRSVAFVCFPGHEETELLGKDWNRSLYYGTLQSISTVFLFFTLVIYILIPELRDLQGKCIMSTLQCQLLGYLFLAGIQFRGHAVETTTCLVAAFFLYFWMLASFFWLNIVSFNVWRTVWFKRFFLTDNQLFWSFCLYGWFCPTAFLVAALATHHMPVTDDSLLRPNFGLSKCWFDGNTETWVYFMAPISILLVCNLVLFVMTAVRLWKTNDCESMMPGLRSSRFKCQLYLKLFMIMGMLWIFEVFAFLFKGYDGFWHIPDTLNSLQGVFIFIIVACRKRVIMALSKRKWGKNIVTRMCPRRCISGPDLEQEEPMLNGRGEDETYVPMDAAGKEDT